MISLFLVHTEADYIFGLRIMGRGEVIAVDLVLN
jgi:hypothetical protein